MKKPYKYAGSKSRILKHITPHFPTQMDEFIDCFAGGLSVSMWMRENYPDLPIQINDNNKELVSMWKQVKHNYEETRDHYHKIVEEYLNRDQRERREFYYEVREQYGVGYRNFTDAYLAAALLFLLQLCFGGIWRRYKFADGRFSTAVGEVNQKAGFFEGRIESLHNFLMSVEINEGDFEDLTPRTERPFIYADPPYRTEFPVPVDYTEPFTDEDQIRLAGWLKQRAVEGAYIGESNIDLGDNFWEELYEKEYFQTQRINHNHVATRGEVKNRVIELYIHNTPLYLPFQPYSHVLL